MNAIERAAAFFEGLGGHDELARELRAMTAPSQAALDEMTWALCPVFLAADQCDWPQILNGPWPVCRNCPEVDIAPNGNVGTAGCRVIAQQAAHIALAQAASRLANAELAANIHADEAEQWRERLSRAEAALAESVKLQAHYAAILNDYDGGERMIFKDAAEWLERLDDLAARRQGSC